MNLNFQTKNEFKFHEYSVGDYWVSSEGTKKIVKQSGDRYFIQNEQNPRIMEIVSYDDLWFEAYKDVSNNRSRELAKIASEKEKKQEEQERSLFGFEKTLNPKQRGAAIKYLNKNTSVNGNLMKIKDFVKQCVDDGATHEKREGKDAFVLPNDRYFLATKYEAKLFDFLKGSDELSEIKTFVRFVVQEVIKKYAGKTEKLKGQWCLYPEDAEDKDASEFDPLVCVDTDSKKAAEKHPDIKDAEKRAHIFKGK